MLYEEFYYDSATMTVIIAVLYYCVITITFIMDISMLFYYVFIVIIIVIIIITIIIISNITYRGYEYHNCSEHNKPHFTMRSGLKLPLLNFLQHFTNIDLSSLQFLISNFKGSKVTHGALCNIKMRWGKQGRLSLFMLPNFQSGREGCDHFTKLAIHLPCCPTQIKISLYQYYVHTFEKRQTSAFQLFVRFHRKMSSNTPPKTMIL